MQRLGNRQRVYGRGRWELERERHQLPDRDPPYPDRAYPIAEVVAAVREELGLEQQARWEQELLEEWVKIIGPRFARHVRPGRYRDGTLVLFVSHPVWLSELFRNGTDELLSRLQQRFGADRIRSVRLQLDPDLNPES